MCRISPEVKWRIRNISLNNILSRVGSPDTVKSANKGKIRFSNAYVSPHKRTFPKPQKLETIINDMRRVKSPEILVPRLALDFKF